MKTPELEKSALQVPGLGLRSRPGKRRIDAGAFVAQRELVTIRGEAISVPEPERYVHLQFRRFAGCPICDLHLRTFARRHEEIVGAGIREVVVFHSPLKELLVHASELPFAVLADPQKRLYAEFGVGASARSLLDPRAWGAIAQAAPLRLWEVILRRKSAPSLHNTGGRLGLPADFLLASDGTVLASKYGVHAYDQWSVDDLLGLVAPTKAGTVRSALLMKSPAELHQELRQRILNLSGVTERQNAGIHEDAFLVGRTMFMHIHGHGHCDIRLSKGEQERVLTEGKARPHRWAPKAGYVTTVVKDEKDLEPAMELIRMSHGYFVGKQQGA